MRRPIKPFAVEVRRSSRKSPGSGPQAGSDEAPDAAVAPQPAPKAFVEETDQGYLAALRAADAFFGNAPETARQVSPAMRAAEDAFKPVQKDVASPASPPPETGRRILPSLIDRHSLPDDEQDPGADDETLDQAPAESDAADPDTPRRSRLGRTRHSPVRRLDASQIDAAAYAAHLAPVPRAATPSPDSHAGETSPVPAPSRLAGYVRGRIYARWVTHEAIRPGERWKLRLGRLVK
ncbi:MAG: hypothetical protein JWL93_1977 [Hyphomicrobiales bacterium]|nr:hypothetical protein [Hyphomicrobiales bacterium]